MIGFAELPDSPWSARSDYLDSVPDAGCHIADFPQTFIGAPGGEGLWLDPIRNQIWHVDAALWCKRVIGPHCRRGYRDGPGAQALVALGGFYGISTSVVRRSDGVWLFTDAGNNAIRTAVDDGQWTVGTFAINFAQCDTLVLDLDGNLWAFANYAGVGKFDPQGNQLAFYAFQPRVFQGATCDSKGRVYVNTKQNSCSQLWQVNPDGTFTLIAGISEEDHDAEIAAGTAIVDGPATHAFIYTAGITYMSPDGEEFLFSAGDTRNARRFLRSTGRVDTLDVDGVYREFQDIRGGAQTYTAYGKQPDTGLPYSTRQLYENFGTEGSSLFKKLIVVPNGGGGQVVATNLRNTFSADGKQVTLSWDPVPGAVFDVRLDNTANNSPAATDGWFVNDGTDFIVDGQFINSFTAVIVPGNKYTWWVHVNGGPQATAQFTAPTQGGDMTKTGTMTYGDFTAPGGTSVSGVQVDLIAADGAVTTGPKVPPGTPTVTMDVPEGTGWTLRATTLDQNGNPLGNPAVSSPFDVAPGTTVVQIVVSIAVS